MTHSKRSMRVAAATGAALVIVVSSIALGQSDRWYPSRWGADDQRGAANRITPAKVLEAKEFGYPRELERWRPRKKADQPAPQPSDNWFGVGYALAKALEVLLWIAAGALIAYALWWAARMLPRRGTLRAEPYRPPAALFGMDLAPETLPPDVAAAAVALAREGKLREALSLLYRGALSELVHKRGVQLLASHTEGEAVRLAGIPYFASLVDSWRSCAYARRMPSPEEVERLAGDYKAAFA